jgi:hypothetical protein
VRTIGSRLGLLVALLVSVSLLSLGGVSGAADNSCATHAVITSVTDNGSVPFLAGDSPFSVGVKTVNDSGVQRPPCGSMTVTLSASGAGTLTAGSIVVQAPATTGTIGPATYATPTGAAGELSVQLCVAPAGAPSDPASCRAVDFGTPGATRSNASTGTSFSLTEPDPNPPTTVAPSSSSIPSCPVDSTHPVCGVWVFPNGSDGVTVYATYITCSNSNPLTECRGGISVKTQTAIESLSSLYDNSGPNKFYLLYLFCGNNVCPGSAKNPNGINAFSIQTRLPDGTWTNLPACTSKVKDKIAYPGYSPTSLQACTAYNDSNRSAGSNTLMLVGRFAIAMNIDPGSRIH